MKAVFLICLIATAMCFQSQKNLQSLQGQNFGNLFAQIKAQIKAGGPLANIEALLDQLTQQVEDEQMEHDEMLTRNQASCTTEVAFREGEISEGQAAFRRATNQLAACENSRDKAEVDLAQTIQDIADSMAALASATRTREEENALYVANVAYNRGAISTVQGAYSILDELVSEEAGLVQLSQHTAMLLRTGVKAGMSKHYAPVIATLAQMATSDVNMFLDEGAVGRVRAMLDELVANLEASLQDYIDVEGASQDAFNTLKANLEQSIADLEGNKVNLEDHLEEMAQCVLEEQLLVTKSTEKVERNTNLLNLTTEMCDAFEAEHAEATESRKEELELLRTVRKIVRRRAEGLSMDFHGE